MKKSKVKKLIPVDLKQCQTMIREGSFMSFGIPEEKRCTNEAYAILTETKVNKIDGQKGSMAVCENCLKVARKKLPKGFFTLKKISQFALIVYAAVAFSYCAPKAQKQEQSINPFGNVYAICKESDDGGLCFCCHGENFCYAGYYEEASSFWQMTCDQAYQMNFKIIRKGQKSF